MPLHVTLSFADAPQEPIAGLIIHRCQIRDALSELFDVQLAIASTDLSLDMQTVVGHPITVGFEDEPFLPRMTGIVRLCRQLTSVLQVGSNAGAALYEIEVVPPHWLLTRRRDHRIFQNQTVPQIVDTILAGYAGRIPASKKKLSATYAPREYCVQYGETDHDFLARILAEEKIAWFFDHANQSALTLCDDTSSMTPTLGQAIPFAATSNLNANTPHVFNVLVSSRVETSAVTLRDYDYENPRLKLEGKEKIFAAQLFTSEADLEVYRYEVGNFKADAQGNTSAELELDARRALSRTFSCEANFSLPPGTRVSLLGHPRPEPNSGLLVVRTRVLADDGGAGGARATHLLECIEKDALFFPERRPRPKIHGTQTAFVVGDAPEGTVDVDTMGRVKLAFPWDRRDPKGGAPTRRVRVSQGWAGSGFGLVTLPRIGDEVVVTYADGDPDEPLVVGRVHNATVVTPLLLPDKDKTLSVWRSRSFSGSGPGAGFNQILMDDKQGSERIELHAERDFKSETGHNSVTTVGKNQSSTTLGHSTNTVAGAYSLTSGSAAVSTGAHTLNAKTIDETGRDHINITTKMRTDASQVHTIDAISVHVHGKSAIRLSVGGSEIDVEDGSIKLSNGGSSIKITSGAIDITSNGTITISGAVVDVKGAPIKLNS